MWSSEQYRVKGLSVGRSESLLENCIEQIESVYEVKSELPSLLTLNHLCERTGISLKRLRSYISREDKDAYAKFSIAKRSGGRRYINIPAPQLSKTQKWIHKYILSQVEPGNYSYAFTMGKSIKDCAAQHCGARWIIKLDIINFFESISEIQVFHVFNSLGYQPLVAFELARLCTIGVSDASPRKRYENWKVLKKYNGIIKYEQELLGYLPQGAPSSPLLSNLVMRECDIELSKIAKKYKLKYTRYSDDITFSSRSNDFSRDKASEIIKLSNKVLSAQGFLSNFKKAKVISPGAKKVVLGLNVDGSIPRLQKEFKDKIRKHLYYSKKFGPVNHVLEIGFDSVWGFRSYLRGMIDYAKMIEPDYAKGLLDEFNTIDWPY